jgi:hypothetical protein
MKKIYVDMPNIVSSQKSWSTFEHIVSLANMQLLDEYKKRK